MPLPSRPQNVYPDVMPNHRLPACRRCGYDLRGSSDRGTCPECGAAFDFHTGVGLARPGERDAPTLTWMDRVSRYGNVMFWGFIALTILSLFLLIEGPTLRTGIVAASLLLAALLVVIGRMTWPMMRDEPDAELGPNLVTLQATPPPGPASPSRNRAAAHNPFDPTLEHGDGIEVEGMDMPDPPAEDDDVITLTEEDELR